MGGGYNYDLLIWLKTNPMPLYNRHYLPDKEYIVFITDKQVGPMIPNFNAARTVFQYPINLRDKRKWGHPTIKPLPIIERLVENSSKEGDIVLDPFMGSGTTAVAAKSLGRHWLGFETNPDYCRVAEERLGELKLF